MTEHLLSLLLFTPLAGMFLILAIPDNWRNGVRWAANGTALVTFLISLLVLGEFHSATGGFQLMERADSIPTLGVQYALGVDGVSLLLVLLTTVITFLALLASWQVEHKVKSFHALFLLIETATLGVFLSLDAFLFYLFFDLVLIPMYFVIALWGGPRRLYASMKFFLYTLTGSVLMLLGILALYFQHKQQFGFYSFEITNLMRLNMPVGMQHWSSGRCSAGSRSKCRCFRFTRGCRMRT